MLSPARLEHTLMEVSMSMLIRVDLSKLEVVTLKQLYHERVLSRDEFKSEMMRRGHDEYFAIQMVRDLDKRRSA